MKRLILSAVAALTMTACAGGYRAAYVTGAVTKEFVTTEHARYDEQARNKLEQCDPEKNPDNGVETKADFDECMTPQYSEATQEKIVQALGVYKAAAEAASGVLLAVDPARGGGKKLTTEQKAELRKSVEATVAAAIEALSLFPEGEKLAKKLEALLP